MSATLRSDIALEPVDSCPVCRSSNTQSNVISTTDFLSNIGGDFFYSRCRECELIYLNPRPIPEDLPKCYESYHTHEAEALPANFLGPWSGARRWVRGGVLSKKFGYHHLAPSPVLSWVACLLDVLPPVRRRARCGLGAGPGTSLPRFTGNGRALDVGAGSGFYAATLARLGWDVVGVDFDASAADAAARTHNLKMHVGSLESAGFEDGYFDFISMNQIIEHLPDPVATLRECHRVLRPGGLLMLHTPNTKGIGRTLFGRFWRGLEAPRHLCLFNPASLKVVLAAAGFRVTRINSSLGGATQYYVRSSMRNRAQALRRSDNRFAVETTAFLSGLVVKVSHFAGWRIGDDLHVEAIREPAISPKPS